jgi:hypothetical protein
VFIFGLENKFFQAITGDYRISDFLGGHPLIVFTYIGLLALWEKLKIKNKDKGHTIG